MASIRELVRDVVEGYAVKGANFESFLTMSPDGNLLTVVDVAQDDRAQHFTATSIIVRVVGDQLVIEHDDNDKPLVDALVQCGIPREKIILAYAGESVTATA